MVLQFSFSAECRTAGRLLLTEINSSLSLSFSVDFIIVNETKRFLP